MKASGNGQDSHDSERSSNISTKNQMLDLATWRWLVILTKQFLWIEEEKIDWSSFKSDRSKRKLETMDTSNHFEYLSANRNRELEQSPVGKMGKSETINMRERAHYRLLGKEGTLIDVGEGGEN